MRQFLAALLGATVLSVSGTVAALATDLPVKAPMYTKAPIAAPRYDWSGFYAGGHFGYIWGRTRVEEDGVETEHNASTDGVIGGVLAGYNWQNGPVVLGVEGDFGWSNAHGVGVTIPNTITTQAPNTYDLRWTTHARARAGYAANDWLFYVAGGFALADLSVHEGAITTTVVSDGGKYYGWSVGGGVEHAFTRNLVGRVEYLYDDFGHKDYIGVAGDAYRVSLTGQTLRGALAWKFDPYGMKR
jgi:outer membrane immunogenic protein